MTPQAKSKEILLIGGLILTFVVSIVLFSSKQDVSVSPSHAKSGYDIFNLTPSYTPTASVQPTLLRSKNQDVPLKVLGSKQEQIEPSYLYTELTSKGLISNVTSTSATILWLTEAPQQSTLRFGINAAQLPRKFTSLTPTYIHEAKLTGLGPNTLYYYTGHAPIIGSFTSAPVLATPPFAQKISGTLTGGEGLCLIRGQLSRSDESSAYATVTTRLATWELPITGLRKADFSAYFSSRVTDILEIDALCVSDGKVLFSGSKKLSFATALKENILLRLRQDN